MRYGSTGTTGVSFVDQIKIITDFIVPDLGYTEECYWVPQPHTSLHHEFLPAVRPQTLKGSAPQMVAEEPYINSIKSLIKEKH